MESKITIGESRVLSIVLKKTYGFICFFSTEAALSQFCVYLKEFNVKFNKIKLLNILKCNLGKNKVSNQLNHVFRGSCTFFFFPDILNFNLGLNCIGVHLFSGLKSMNKGFDLSNHNSYCLWLKFNNFLVKNDKQSLEYLINLSKLSSFTVLQFFISVVNKVFYITLFSFIKIFCVLVNMLKLILVFNLYAYKKSVIA